MSPASEPWTSWLSDDALSLETQALTKALQMSLSSNGNDSSSSSSLTITQQPAPASGRDRHRNSPIPGPQQTGKVAKRKSRAKKRAPTTYINADPADFRVMVQRMTGAGFGPVVIKPEPRVQSFSFQPNTLDSSSGFFADRVGPAGLVGLGPVVEPLPVPGEEEALVFDVDEFLSFPTLESWGVA